jgi:hypothetical protein
VAHGTNPWVLFQFPLAGELAEQLSQADITAAVETTAAQPKRKQSASRYDDVDLAQMSFFDAVSDDDVLKELKAKDESKQEMIAKIAVETKGFTVISKTDCEQLILRVSAMLEQEGGNS